MNQHALRFIFLLWLCWYLSGPLFEMIDHWDTPQEEMSDVGWSASGTLSLMAAGVSIGILVFRKFRELCSYLAARATFEKPVRLVTFKPLLLLAVIMPAPGLDTSPSLRI